MHGLNKIAHYYTSHDNRPTAHGQNCQEALYLRLQHSLPGCPWGPCPLLCVYFLTSPWQAFLLWHQDIFFQFYTWNVWHLSKKREKSWLTTLTNHRPQVTFCSSKIVTALPFCGGTEGLSLSPLGFSVVERMVPGGTGYSTVTETWNVYATSLNECRPSNAQKVTVESLQTIRGFNQGRERPFHEYAITILFFTSL